MRETLLDLGAPCETEEEWADYSVLGDVEEEKLAAYAFDQSEDMLVRQHAWRALASRQAVSYYDQFVNLLIDESFQLSEAVFTEDFLKVAELLGEGAIPLLMQTLSEREPLRGFDVAIVLALERFARQDAHRSDIVKQLSSELARLLPTHLANAQMVFSLVELEAVEEIDVVRSVYTADLVNQGLSGSLSEVESDLGVDITGAESDETVNLIAKYQYLERKVVLGDLPEEADVYGKTEYFLKLYGSEATCDGASSVEGVLAMALLMEQLVPLEELLAVIWSASPDGGLPIWQSRDEEDLFLDSLLDIQTSVSKQMAEQKYFPMGELRDPEAATPTTPLEEFASISFGTWAFGVLRGFAQFLPEDKQKASPWVEFEQQVTQLALHELKETVPERAEEHPLIDVLGELVSLRLASQAGAIDALAHHQTEPIKAEKLPGRNEPCPCQSGKKYKKCCGA